MPEPIVTLNEESLRSDLRELVRRTVEEVLNGLLDGEAGDLVGAERYERTADRGAYRAGHYERKLATTSGEVTIRMPKLKGMRFATAIIERYRRRETSVEEAMIEMYLAGVSTRRIEDVSEMLWGSSVSAATVSNLNEKAFEAVEEWRNGPLERAYPYACVDGICLKRSWGGSYENVAVMVAIGVNDDGYREAIGAAEGFTGSSESEAESPPFPLTHRVPFGHDAVNGERGHGMGHPSPRYSAEFKQQAVRLHRERGGTYAETARELGVDPGSLSDWVKKADTAQASPEDNPFKVAEENRRLRREVERLRRENEVLLKASAFFASRQL